MKIFIITLFICFFLTAMHEAFAGNNSFVAYYPSAGGSYNQINLTYPNTGEGRSTINSSPCTAANEGLLYFDPTLNTLQICTNGKSQAVPYPETCFNRFCSYLTSSGTPCSFNSCPTGYTQAIGISDSFSTSSNYTVISTVCCSAPTIGGQTTPSTVHP